MMRRRMTNLLLVLAASLGETYIDSVQADVRQSIFEISTSSPAASEHPDDILKSVASTENPVLVLAEPASDRLLSKTRRSSVPAGRVAAVHHEQLDGDAKRIDGSQSATRNTASLTEVRSIDSEETQGLGTSFKPTSSAKRTDPSPLDHLLKTVHRVGFYSLGLIALTAILYATRGVSVSRGKPKPASSFMQCESISIGPRCSVHLIRFDEHAVMVSRDAQGIKQMLVIPPKFDNTWEQPIPSEDGMAQTVPLHTEW